MKKIFLLLIICIFHFTVFAQKSDVNQLIEDAKTMIKSTKNKNFDAILDLTYPKLFEISDRESMKKEFELMTADDKIKFLTEDNAPIEVKGIFDDAEKNKYAIIQYPNVLSMNLGKKSGKEEQDMMKSIFEMQGLKAEFISEDTVILHQNSIVIAIQDKLTNGKWLYLSYGNNDEMLSKIISAEILEKAKSIHKESTNK